MQAIRNAHSIYEKNHKAMTCKFIDSPEISEWVYHKYYVLKMLSLI